MSFWTLLNCFGRCFTIRRSVGLLHIDSITSKKSQTVRPFSSPKPSRRGVPHTTRLADLSLRGTARINGYPTNCRSLVAEIDVNLTLKVQLFGRNSVGRCQHGLGPDAISAVLRRVEILDLWCLQPSTEISPRSARRPRQISQVEIAAPNHTKTNCRASDRNGGPW